MKKFNLSAIALVLISLVSCNSEYIPSTFEKVGNSYIINYVYDDIEYDIRTCNPELTKDVYLVQKNRFMQSPVCDETCQNLNAIFAAIHHYGYEKILLQSAYNAGTTDGTTLNFSGTGVLLYAYKSGNKVYLTLYQLGKEPEEQVYKLY